MKKDVILLKGRCFLSYSYMLEKGIGRKSIEKWSERKPEYKYKANGITYIMYAGIPAPSRAKLPSEEKLKELYYIQEQEREETNRLILKSKVNNTVKPQIDYAIDRGFAKWMPFYNDLLPGTSKHERRVLYAKKHALAEVILSFLNTYTLKELFDVYLTIDKKIAKVRSYIKFTVAVKKWKQEINFCSEIKEGRGRKKMELSQGVIQLIRSEWSHPNQKSFTTVHEKVKKYCDENGLKECPSRSTIVNYLSQPMIKNVLMKKRNNKRWNRDNQFSPHFDKPLYANDLWEIDGTPIQIKCWNKTRTEEIRLELTAIIDAHSGYIVGYDLSVKEDFISWKRAIKMAIDNTRSIPCEMRHDNHGLTKMPDFKYLKSKIVDAGCFFNATKPLSANEKSFIERWFETFQNVYQREVNGFIGEGIKSRNPNARIDPEYYSKFKYTYDEMQTVISTKIKEYNENTREGKTSPEELYKTSKKPNSFKVDEIAIPLMFWNYKEILVRKGEVKITIQKIEYRYHIKDVAIANMLNGTQVKVYYDEDDLSTVQLVYNNDIDSMELRQNPKIYKDKASSHLNEADALYKAGAKMKATAKYADEQYKDLLGVCPVSDKEGYNNAETQEYLKESEEYSKKSDLRMKQQKKFQDVKPSLKPINYEG